MVKIAHVVTTLYETNATGWVTALAEDQLYRGCQVDLIVGHNASQWPKKGPRALGLSRFPLSGSMCGRSRKFRP